MLPSSPPWPWKPGPALHLHCCAREIFIKEAQQSGCKTRWGWNIVWSDLKEQLLGSPGRVCHLVRRGHSVPRRERWWIQPGSFWFLQTAEEPRELSLLHTLRLESNKCDSLITVFNLSSVTRCQTHLNNNNFLLQAEMMLRQKLSHFASTEHSFTYIFNKFRTPEVNNLNHNNTSAVALSPMVVSSVWGLWNSSTWCVYTQIKASSSLRW